jgi:glyoxylase-like metal-dependent hydrolase (beta-lactamase superfamily II)/rhodanese-related sulfurtransferase
MTKEISPLDLYERLNRGDDLKMVDVRNEEEFKAGRVEGRQAVPTVHVPYFGFLEDEAAAVAQIPFAKDDAIVVVCAKGGSSEFVAGVLAEQGYTNLYNLSGGTQLWADFYAVRDVVPPSDDLMIIQFDRPGKASLSYLIASQGEALVMDPNRNIEPYIAEAKARGLTITHVLDSHVHADYISGGAKLAETLGATYHLSGACGFAGALAIDGKPGPVRLGSLKAKKIATPGHTPGSTSLYVNDRFLFTGDTLFVASIGRPDLGGHAAEWAVDLYRTLFEVLAPLPDSTMVLPAHYADFAEMRHDGIVAGDLGTLRRENEGMQPRSVDEFIAFIDGNMRPAPEHYGQIRQINLAAVTACEDSQRQLDLGKNECAASKGRPAAISG